MKAERKSRAAVAPLVTLTEEQRAKVLTAIRSRTEEEGECLRWTGALSRGSKSHKVQPAFWMDGKTVALRRMAYVAYGKELFAHWLVSTSCGNDDCLCEKHLKRVSKAETQIGTTRGLITRTRIAAAHQKRSPLNWDLVREIRASSESNRAIASRLSLHRDTVHKVRNHVTWRETGMFSALVAAR